MIHGSIKESPYTSSNTAKNLTFYEGGKRNAGQEAPKYAIPVLTIPHQVSPETRNKGGKQKERTSPGQITKNLESSKSILICEFSQVITAINRRLKLKNTRSALNQEACKSNDLRLEVEANLKELYLNL